MRQVHDGRDSRKGWVPVGTEDGSGDEEDAGKEKYWEDTLSIPIVGVLECVEAAWLDKRGVGVTQPVGLRPRKVSLIVLPGGI
jgi:hypothetical protein